MRRGFTLLELLLAVFLSTLLLVFLYQSFGQVARQFRLAHASPDPLEAALFREQVALLRQRPSFREGVLRLPLDTPFGPWEVRYDLERGLYAELEPGGEDAGAVFPDRGLRSLALYALEDGERRELDPEEPWPEDTPLLLVVRFADGAEAQVVLP